MRKARGTVGIFTPAQGSVPVTPADESRPSRVVVSDGPGPAPGGRYFDASEADSTPIPSPAPDVNALIGQIEEGVRVFNAAENRLPNPNDPRSISFNLTNALKKSAKRLGIAVPWESAENADGTRRIWRDRHGIAARMVKAIEDERARRGLP